MLVVVGQSSAFAQANAMQTALASSKAMLFKEGFTPTFLSTLENFEEFECDFSGYTAGGTTITAWFEPATTAGNGATIGAPSVQWNFVPPADPDPAVPNVVAGFAILLAGGDLYGYHIFDNTVNMNAVGKVVRIYPEMYAGVNPSV